MLFIGMGRPATPIGAAVLALAMGIGCAGGGQQRKEDSALSSGYGGPASAANDDDGLEVVQEHGTLDQGEVERTLERHMRALVACYDRAGDAQKFVAGNVNLRFTVAPSGQVDDVLVLASDVGNYAVERCLVVEGRKIAFRAPRGAKGTDFEYSLQFRSTGERPVVDLAPEAVTQDVLLLSGGLGSCGQLGPSDVKATAYIETDGQVTSVGLSSEAAMSPEAAICVVEQIRQWKLPADGTHVARASFPVVVSTAALSSMTKPEARRMAKRSRRGR